MREVRFIMERMNVINKGQRQELDKCKSDYEANNLLYQFLCDDPAPETLEGAANILKSAPGTTNMNKSCAKAIEEFLRIDTIQTLEGEWIDCYV